jgi:pimeloyl-ACP methyl ester carboxylesterase
VVRRRLVTIAFLVCAVLSAAAGVAVGTPNDTPPSLSDACGSGYADVPAHSLWAETSDGVQLYMVDIGSGATSVVLAHGGRSDLCETLHFATQLVAKGYRIVAFDFRGNGRSQSPPRNRVSLGRDLSAAVAHARQTGAKHVFLIGSSMGGAAIVQNTSALRVAGRISLSGTRLWKGYGVDSPAGVARIRDPFLYVGTRHDWRAPLKEAVRIFRRVGARDKRAAFYPGSDHGWDIIETSRFASKARSLVLGWIARHS